MKHLKHQAPILSKQLSNQSRKQRNQELQERYKRAMEKKGKHTKGNLATNKSLAEQNKQTKNRVIEQDLKWKEEYEAEKKKRRSLEKQLKNIQINEKKKKNKLQKIQQRKDIKTQKKLTQYQNEIQEQEKRIYQLEKQIEDEKREKELYEYQVNELKKRATLSKTEEEFSKYKQKYSDVKIHNADLKNQIGELKQKIRFLESIHVVESRKELEQEIHNLRKVIIEKESKINAYQEIHQPSNLLQILMGTLTVDNLSYFYNEKKKNIFGDIARKIDLLQKSQKPKNKQLEEYDKFENEDQTDNHVTYKTGFVSNKEGKWYFYDINASEDEWYNIYQVVSKTSKRVLKPNLPVRARIVDGKAIIKQIYDLPDQTIQKQKQEQKNERNKTVEKHSYPFLGEGKVLIVGSRYLSKYKNRLMQHGVEVETHNPYEESYDRLDDKIKQADVIIICTSHVPHAVMDHLLEDDKRVELMENDTEESIVTRTRYAFVNKKT